MLPARASKPQNISSSSFFNSQAHSNLTSWPNMTFKTLVGTLLVLSTSAVAADLRIGIIGCDTSHVIAFTETLNDPAAKSHVAGGKVVAAYRGGSEDIPSSASRVDGYAKTLREKYGVRFYDTIE